MKHWAALDKDKNVIIVGMTNPLVNARFDRRCFSFSCGDFAAWVIGGARYCELFMSDLSEIIGMGSGHARPGLHISQFQHGRIRRSEDVPWILN